jgi:hypothetical protein
MANVIRDCFIFCGQSNGMTFFPSPSTAFPGGWTTDANIRLWNGNGTANAWDTYIPNTNSNPPGVSGGAYWGPEAEFARQWRIDNPTKAIFIVKRCIGGQGMINTSTGTTWSAYDSASSYRDLVDDVVAAANNISATTRLSVRGIFWIGNESDTTDSTAAGRVQYELESFIDGLRSAISAFSAKGIVVVTKNQGPNGASTPTVRAAQKYVGTLQNNCFVDEDPELSFAGTGAGSHLIPASVVELGRRAYVAWKTDAAPLLLA